MKKLLLGALECCDLPDLGISNLPVRVDTGATTSALHVENLKEFQEKGRRWVSFDLHPDIHNTDFAVKIKVRVKGRKKVKSSSADTQHRVVIETTLGLGKKEWPIKLTLTDRSEMNYPMLLGRQAMAGHVIVDPELEYQQSTDHSDTDPE